MPGLLPGHDWHTGGMHVKADALRAGRPQVLAAPADVGSLELIVARPQPDQRLVLEQAQLDDAQGLSGDVWLARGNRHRPDGTADPDAQITVMNVRVAALLAGCPQRIPLAGDQLYVDLDLSLTNLPVGSRLHIGLAVLQVTASPHTGCAKFVSRFGEEATRFVNSRESRAHRWRGMNTRVVHPGLIRRGDSVRIHRAGQTDETASGQPTPAPADTGHRTLQQHRR